METITIEPNKIFAWHKGLRLVPNEKATIEFPGGLISNGKKIGEIIEVSDDAEIGFQKSKDSGEVFSRIILRVAKGDGIRLNRSTQAILVGETSITFQIER